MPEHDVTRIKINNCVAGIVGLKAALEEMAEDYAAQTDEEIGHELLDRLSKQNYISEEQRANYRRAFVHEFRKFLGQPVEENLSGDLEIKILGQGCVQCNHLEKLVMELLAEMKIEADVEHVGDLKEIGTYGVMGMPALLINGKVMSVGKVPPRSQVKEWLTKFTSTQYHVYSFTG
jgi:small redox-active disulfide protein 2